jgi:hypothetical protein
MTFNEDYINELEDTIGKFLKPIEGIPFHIAVKALCARIHFYHFKHQNF